MWRDYYVNEKLRELEAERLGRIPVTPAEPKPRPSAPLGTGLRPLVRLTGRVLRRTGEGLESWAAMQTEEDWRDHHVADGG